MLPRSLIESLSIQPADEQKIGVFLDLFEKWNKRINLSGASTRNELLEHVEDSLHVVSHLRTARRVIDIGSGGGFPVVVAAIVLPDTKFVSLEPIHKKHAYLSTVTRELHLTNLHARAERAERHHERAYDAAMSRATFDIADWIEMGTQFVSPRGIVIGFEAVEHPSLNGVVRHPYWVRGKKRNLVIREIAG